MSWSASALPLPGPLPAGEAIFWRGRPQWRALALRAFHVRLVAAYFGLFAVWRIASDVMAGAGIGTTATAVLWLLVPCAAACGVLALLAWLSSRATQYTITSRRIIMQVGVALPITLNIPFNAIGGAALRSYADGSGDIPLTIAGTDRVAYLMLWPHVRPWHVTRTEPMLRAIADARRVSEILACAVLATVNASGAGEAAIAVEKTLAGAVPARTAVAAA